MTTALTVRALTLQIQGKTLLKPMDFAIERGSLFAILGPNGAGKTLLLRSLAGLIASNAKAVSRHDQSLAWVPLSQTLPFSFSVEELVMMGRFRQHQGFPQKQDHDWVDRCLTRLGIKGLAKRSYNSLSRGEQSKVDVARALVTEAELILLDEPFSNLDIDSALHMTSLLKDLVNEGKTVVLSHHDLYTVRDLASHALLLKGGEIVAIGSLGNVFREDLLRQTYNVRALFPEGAEHQFIRFESLDRT